tara:strand:+ start:483 stop:854 length:372 start_codon:yes stop_codon:yes gene_type:complete
MASLSWQVKAYLISKGKTEEEANALFSNEPAEVELSDNGSGPKITTWDVSGITKPTNSQLTAVDTAATKLGNNYAVRKKRRKEYNSLGDQLDLLYKDIVAGKLDTNGEWAKHIKAVKEANPKS